MQESFTRLLKKYGPDMHNSSLLFKIARNALIDHTRRINRDDSLGETLQDPSIGTERLLMIRQEYQTVFSAIRQLEITEREILTLASDGDFSYREIAELTGTSEGNVRVKVHRARKQLKKILQQESKR